MLSTDNDQRLAQMAARAAITDFECATELLMQPRMQKWAAVDGNHIGHHALFMGGEWREAAELAQDIHVFRTAIPRFTRPAGDLYSRVAGLVISVWKSDIDGANSSLGFMLRRDELGIYHFDISRALHQEGKEDDTALARYTGDPEKKAQAVGELIATALVEPLPHRALDTHPAFTVRPAGVRAQ